MDDAERLFNYECKTCGVGKMGSNIYQGEEFISPPSVSCLACGDRRNVRVFDEKKTITRKLTIRERFLGYIVDERG